MTAASTASLRHVEILSLGKFPPATAETLGRTFAVRTLAGSEIPFEALAGVRGIARCSPARVDRKLIEGLPNLEIIANFGVGYDDVDVACAAKRRAIVTNTPDILTEEVADTALGLLINVVRELPAAERYLRAGKWRDASYRLTPASLRNRRVGIVGLGRIGLAVARRLDAMRVPVVYHGRHRQAEVAYTFYSDLRAMAADVDTIVVAVPGGAETRRLIDAQVLKALGTEGILINIGRGAVVDEAALIEALANGTILAAGLDVFENEPNVSKDLLALPNTVLLPHVGSASVYTRNAMGQMVVDNLTNWFAVRRPLTLVSETPWPTT